MAIKHNDQGKDYCASVLHFFKQKSSLHIQPHKQDTFLRQLLFMASGWHLEITGNELACVDDGYFVIEELYSALDQSVDLYVSARFDSHRTAMFPISKGLEAFLNEIWQLYGANGERMQRELGIAYNMYGDRTSNLCKMDTANMAKFFSYLRGLAGNANIPSKTGNPSNTFADEKTVSAEPVSEDEIEAEYALLSILAMQRMIPLAVKAYSLSTIDDLLEYISKLSSEEVKSNMRIFR